VSSIFQKHQHHLKTISCFVHGEGMVSFQKPSLTTVNSLNPLGWQHGASVLSAVFDLIALMLLVPRPNHRFILPTA